MADLASLSFRWRVRFKGPGRTASPSSNGINGEPGRPTRRTTKTSPAKPGRATNGTGHAGRGELSSQPVPEEKDICHRALVRKPAESMAGARTPGPYLRLFGSWTSSEPP